MAHPVAAAVVRIDRAPLVLARVTTADGLSGTAYIMGYTRAGAAAVVPVLPELFALVQGRSALAVEETWRRTVERWRL